MRITGARWSVVTTATTAKIATLPKAAGWISAARDRGVLTCVASGGFDPIHPGHIGYLEATADRAWARIREAPSTWKARDPLIVVLVNGDGFLARKKGRPFQPLVDRVAIVAALRCVDVVVPYDDDSQTVDRGLEILQPDAFAKGGDRVDRDSIPEWDTCERLKIEIWTGIGPGKVWSSSTITGPLR